KEAKLSLTFKCKVCNVYNSNEISKVAYTQGVVLIQCTGCDNRHLIADNLNWFEDYKSNLDTIAKSNDEMV
ncbi:zf-DNL-domain-containing protein, partial [Neoconidiobolus thromboides FSU 785]